MEKASETDVSHAPMTTYKKIRACPRRLLISIVQTDFETNCVNRCDDIGLSVEKIRMEQKSRLCGRRLCSKHTRTAGADWCCQRSEARRPSRLRRR